MSNRIHCLIFEKSKGSRPAGFTLINPQLLQMAQNSPLSAIKLLSSTAPPVNPEQFNPPRNASYNLIEVWQDLDAFTKPKVDEKPRIYVDKHNEYLIQRFLPTASNISFITRFKINEKCANHQKYTALCEDNLKIIKKLLESGANITWIRQEAGTTLAHFAAEKGSVPLIALLRQLGVNLDGGRNEKITPLHAVVQKKDLATVKALVDNGADIDRRSADGSSALHVATKAGLSDMVQFLAGKGASIDAKTAKGWALLHIAADLGHSEIVALLLKHGADLEPKINSGVDEGATPLHMAIKKNQWQVAKFLVEKGANLNTQCRKGRNALCFAVLTGETAFVEYLINRGIDKTNPGNRKALHIAFGSIYCKVTQKMLELGFSVDAADVRNLDVFFGAIFNNLFEIVERSLQAGADANQVHSFLNEQTTPMHVACRYADAKMVQLLLDHGADPKGVCGISVCGSPMAGAVEFGKVDTVKLLVASSVSVREYSNFFVSATCSRNHEMMNVFLEYGVAVNSKGLQRLSNDKHTALHFASRNGDLTAVDVLFKYGAVFDFKDVSLDMGYPYQKRVTPEFLEAFLARGFTTDLDNAAAAHLDQLLTGYDVKPHASRADWPQCVSQSDLEKKQCAKILAQHVVKMEAAGVVVAGRARSVVPAYFFEAYNLEKLPRECERELNLMKGRKIADTGVTFFDMLTKTLNRVARYTRSEGIQNELGGYEFKMEHPHYGSILECQFHCGNWRRELLDTGIKKLDLMNSRFRALPIELKEGIVEFLTNQDLLTLQKCCKAKQSEQGV